MKKYLNIISLAILIIMVLFANISFAATGSDSGLAVEVANGIVINAVKRNDYPRCLW